MTVSMYPAMWDKPKDGEFTVQVDDDGDVCMQFNEEASGLRITMKKPQVRILIKKLTEAL